MPLVHNKCLLFPVQCSYDSEFSMRGLATQCFLLWPAWNEGKGYVNSINFEQQLWGNKLRDWVTPGHSDFEPTALACNQWVHALYPTTEDKCISFLPPEGEGICWEGEDTSVRPTLNELRLGKLTHFEVTSSPPHHGTPSRARQGICHQFPHTMVDPCQQG